MKLLIFQILEINFKNVNKTQNHRLDLAQVSSLCFQVIHVSILVNAQWSCFVTYLCFYLQ